MSKITDPEGIGFYWEEIDHKKYKYRTTRRYLIYLNFESDYLINAKFYRFIEYGLLEIKEGYKWDGASGPSVDTINTMRASCVHDVLYQMIRRGELELRFKKDADLELKRIMIEDGESYKWLDTLRANYFYWGVRVFGKKYCIPGSEK